MRLGLETRLTLLRPTTPPATAADQNAIGPNTTIIIVAIATGGTEDEKLLANDKILSPKTPPSPIGIGQWANGGINAIKPAKQNAEISQKKIL